MDVAELLPASVQPTQQSLGWLFCARLQQAVVNRNRLPQGRPVTVPRRPAFFSQGEAPRTPTSSSSSSCCEAPPRHRRQIRWPEVALHWTWTRETRDTLLLLYTTQTQINTRTYTKYMTHTLQQPAVHTCSTQCRENVLSPFLISSIFAYLSHLFVSEIKTKLIIRLRQSE